MQKVASLNVETMPGHCYSIKWRECPSSEAVSRWPTRESPPPQILEDAVLLSLHLYAVSATAYQPHALHEAQHALYRGSCSSNRRTCTRKEQRELPGYFSFSLAEATQCRSLIAQSVRHITHAQDRYILVIITHHSHIGAISPSKIALSGLYLLSWTARLYCTSRNTCSVSACISITLQSCLSKSAAWRHWDTLISPLDFILFVASLKLEEPPVYNARK